MIKTLVVEDQPYIRSRLIKLIDELDKGLVISGECGSVSEAIAMAKANDPDLVILDIELGDGNAFDFLSGVESLNFKVIFTTSYDEYAIRALKLGAIDYLLKPVDKTELSVAIDKVIQLNETVSKNEILKVENEWQKSKNSLVLSLQDGFQVIKLDELEFCRSDKGYTKFCLTDGRTFLASGSLKDFECRLPPNTFFRVHKSYIVNLNHIDKFNRKGYIVSKSGYEIPVSSRRKEAFLSIFLN